MSLVADGNGILRETGTFAGPAGQAVDANFGTLSALITALQNAIAALPTPTLDQVLAAGHTSSRNANLGTVTLAGNLKVAGSSTFGGSGGSYAYIYNNGEIISDSTLACNILVFAGGICRSDTSGNLNLAGKLTANSLAGDGSQLTEISWDAITNGNQGDVGVGEFNNDAGYWIAGNAGDGSQLAGISWDAITNGNQSDVNVSGFNNDAGYLTSAAQPGDNISEFNNDAGYLTSAAQPGDNISEFNNDAGYLTSAAQPGDNISEFNNDAGYLTSAAQPGDNVSEFNNDAGYLIPTGTVAYQGDNVSEFNNDENYTVQGSNVSQFANDANYLFPECGINFGDIGVNTINNWQFDAAGGDYFTTPSSYVITVTANGDIP